MTNKLTKEMAERCANALEIPLHWFCEQHLGELPLGFSYWFPRLWVRLEALAPAGFSVVSSMFFKHWSIIVGCNRTHSKSVIEAMCEMIEMLIPAKRNASMT